MQILKNEILNILDEMPLQFDSEEIMYKLFVLEKLKTAEADIESDNLIPNIEIYKMADLWSNK